MTISWHPQAEHQDQTMNAAHRRPMRHRAHPFNKLLPWESTPESADASYVLCLLFLANHSATEYQVDLRTHVFPSAAALQRRPQDFCADSLGVY